MSSIDTWFGYRDQQLILASLLRSEANSASNRIQGFIDGIQNQLKNTVQQPWNANTIDEHYYDTLLFLRQVPAAMSITLVDDKNKEQLFVSRTALNRIKSGEDYSKAPEITNARLKSLWFSDMEYSGEIEPRMSIAVAGERQHSGAAIAEINLKLIRDLISQVRVGRTGYALILNARGELMAHPDISMVLAGILSTTKMQDFRKSFDGSENQIVTTIDSDGIGVVATMAAPLKNTNWRVFVLMPKAEAFGPIYSALWRSCGLLLGGSVLAAALSYMLASRMIGPIRLLEEGAEKIGSGQFDHRIEVTTHDELGNLAKRFNRMAEELAVSQERSERIARLRRFLAPQVAARVEQTGDAGVLESQRAEIVAIFCDLRGFTAFAAQGEPEVIMEVLGTYYRTLGSVIARYQATLTNFAADGLMVLMNAPVPCVDPAIQALQMALDMQVAVQELVVGWRDRGFEIGFGVGLSMGWATVGRIGYEDRVDYTAIGSVVNLASRLCSAAEDRQVLFDQSVAIAVREMFLITRLGTRPLKGYDKPVGLLL